MRSILVLLVVVCAACGKTPAQIDGAAPSSWTSAPPPAKPLSLCEPWIVTELAVPKDWQTYPIVAKSEPEIVLDTRGFDHYVDELVDVPVGPFVLRYWHGRTRPTATSLVLRLAGCEGKPLDLQALTYWNGGAIVLRAKGSFFILSSGGTYEQLLAVFRRLPE